MRLAQTVRRWLAPLGLLALCALAATPARGIERRRPQFPSEPAYLVLPFPYDLPGIGSGIGWTGLAANMFGTHADVYGIVITGDAGGKILGLEDVHLVPERLILNVYLQRIDRALVRQYPTRGMQSPGDSYWLVEADQADENFAELRLTLFDRRFEAYGIADTFKTGVVSIRDPQGNVIRDFSEPYRQKQSNLAMGLLLDETDDYADPRKGVRVEVSTSHAQPQSAQDADYRVWNYSLSGYIPLGRISTWLFNYFRSDADVIRRGDTDPTHIAMELPVTCTPTDLACQAALQALVQSNVDARSNGTAASLGGQDRLRSYPMSRFQGAHTLFYGTELRWNLTEEVTPFDYFIWKDVRTNVQLAFFAETGSVGETRDEVGRTFRSSYGVGLRMVSGSGFVYRADVATGSEGGEVTVIFMYPY
jgi:Omp85 superfamily domain